MEKKPFAFLFPGQGSQSVGMLSELAADYPIVIETFSEASDALSYDLWQLIQTGPEEALNQTEKTQPALLTASVALWRVWRQLGAVEPNYLAGHSLGEYSALVCANAIKFEDAVKLVALRGKFMQEAVPEQVGAMAAIVGMSDDEVSGLCQEVAENEVLAPANFNSIGQVVISGHRTAVERFVAVAKSRGAKLAKVLPVSVPSHCLLMKPAAERLSAILQDWVIHQPNIPVIQNADVKIYYTGDDIRTALINQLYMPVRWVETIQLLVKYDVNLAVECGPGKVLAGLNKRITDHFQTLSFHTKADVFAAFEIISANYNQIVKE